MRLEPGRIERAQLRRGPPPDLRELPLVGPQRHADLTGHREPQAHVHMPALRRVDRLGHRQEERPLTGDRVGHRGDTQLLTDLPHHRRPRILTRLDMPARRQPQPGQPVVTQQHTRRGPVDQQEVRHEMR
jgi:hypothetical protein